MNLRRNRIKVFAIAVLVALAIAACGFYRLHKVEEDCWEQEAVVAFQKYGSLESRADIVRVAYVETDDGSNPLEVIETDPNGCSLGSNGQTVIRFSFDDSDNLTRIQVFRNYIAADYEMTLIDEKVY